LRDRQKELLELLDKSGANLYALLTRLTLREDIAEELMQELFIKLINSRSFDKAGGGDRKRLRRQRHLREMPGKNRRGLLRQVRHQFLDCIC